MAQKEIYFGKLNLEERGNLYENVTKIIEKDSNTIQLDEYTTSLDSYVDTLFPADEDRKSIRIYDLYDTAILVTVENIPTFHYEKEVEWIKRKQWNEWNDYLSEIRVIGKDEDITKAIDKLGLEKYLTD